MKFLKILTILLILVVSNYSAFSQDPGGSPDGPPPAVPFEDYMHLILITGGAIFAFFTIRKLQRKQV